MLQEIKFNSDKFDSDNNELNDLTSNTIILCQNSDIKYTISSEIRKALSNSNYEYADYYYDEDDEYNIEVQYKPTTILKVSNKNNKYNQQKIIFTIEAPFVLQCQGVCDLWFAQIDKYNKIHLYAFTDFKNYIDIWEKGIYYLYKKVINGIFGDYPYEN